MTDFQNYVARNMQYSHYFKCPPNFRCVATLPCKNISLNIKIHNVFGKALKMWTDL